MNKKKLSIASLGMAMLLTTGCSTSTPTAGGDSEAIEMVNVELAPGTLVGYKEDALYSFKGIPYATAERFQDPMPVTSYANGRQLAITYGPVAPQSDSAGNGMPNAHEFMTPSNGTADMVSNENCQYLNVWSNDLEGDKPVVVFFHGGGLFGGASSELSYYTGEYFAEDNDAVFVSVNHRLNVLGYLDVSAYDEDYEGSGMVGMEDCITALEWVQDNIAEFGGDASNVTIVGQSGGGQKVTTLSCMSDSVGLFDKVVMMSGSNSTMTKADGLANAATLVDYLNLSDDEVIPTLTSMSYENLLAAGNAAGCNWNTHVGDGTFTAPLFDSEGNMNEYAAQRTWMVGTTFSEFNDSGNMLIYMGDPTANLSAADDELAMTKLTEMYGDKAQDVADAFAVAYPDHKLIDAAYLNTMPFGLTRKGQIVEGGLLDQFNGAGVTVYNYLSAYNAPYFGGVTMHHTADIPYIFGSVAEIEYQIKGDETAAYGVADAMSQALASFALDGDPTTSSLDWMPYTDSEHYTMVFDRTSECKVDFDKDLYNAIMP